MRDGTTFCFDLDGTVTREEILPLLARDVGLADEIHLLTEATLKGVLPFEQSFRLRCRLLGTVPVSRVQAVVSTVALDPDIAAFIRRHPDRCTIATGNLDVWIEPLVRSLGCTVRCSSATVVDDRLSSVDQVLDKSDVVRWLQASFDRVVAIGDGMNDAAMFEAAEIGIAFGGVHDPVPGLVDLSRYVVMDGRALCRLLDTL